MNTGVIHTVGRRRLLLWLGVMAGLMTLLVLLSVYIKDNPVPSVDQTVLDWITGWDIPGLTGFLEVVSWLTNNWPAMVVGILGIGLLWRLGKKREALSFVIIGVIMGLIAFISDFTLGEVVDRSRPLGNSDSPSFPSGHVFGSTIFYGFCGFLAGFYGLKKKLLVPLLLLITVFILTVGVSRVHLQAHWPTDVAAGLLLGAMGLLILIPLFLYLRQATWFSPWKLREDPTVLGCEKC
ncbi:MAG: phosphatase PAP2 family protein [Chloroflexi bacterium]|nr:phosphatase PAP2 family protein [Chloroflexota bacterium]